ncbi:MAG: hypothetical protein AAFY72_06630 [Cyanobacteria bacterium J06649_4]
MSVVPSQILYLEHGSCRLYAEAIQVISTRHLCWSRPTLLIQGLPESAETKRQEVIADAAQHPEETELSVYDLEGCPDLIWPLAPFQIAYDLDFFAILIQLKMSPNAATQRQGSEQLNSFIQSFWGEHSDLFQVKSPEKVSL